MNKNENAPQTLVEIYNSPEAHGRREQVRREINSMPRQKFRVKGDDVFAKDPVELGKLWTEKAKWRKEIKAQGLTKRNVPMKTYLRVS